MKRILLLDCSLPGVAVAITDAESGRCLSSEMTLPKDGSSTLLAPMVQSVVKKSHMSFAEIIGIAVGIGPGSFTGIRMGLAFAYGLKAALPQVQVAGISSLQAMAASKKGRGAVWILAGTRNQGFLAQEDQAPRSFFLSNLESQLQTLKNEYVLCGNWSDFEHQVGGEVKKIQERELLQYSLDCLAGESKKIDWSASSLNQELPEPMYLRASTAEEKLLAQNEIVQH